MFRHTEKLFFTVALCALLSFTSTAGAGTIVKVSLGGDAAADVEYTGGAGGILSTVNDDIPNAFNTTGDQQTAVEFLGALDSEAADILTNVASFTLDNVQASGLAFVAGSLVTQNFTGGTLALYDAANTLLLSGTLTNSTLFGTIGAPAVGGMITTSVGQITGGTLAGFVDANSLGMSIAVSAINGTAGFSVTPGQIPNFATLNQFRADASAIIVADPIPEPATAALMMVGTALAAFAANRRRR